MQTSLSIKFFLYSDIEETSKIYLRITVDRKKAEICLDHAIMPQHWDSQKQRSKNDRRLNEELSFVENKIYEIKRQLQFQNKELTAALIKTIFLGKEPKSIEKLTLLEYYEFYLRRSIENRQENSTIVIGKHRNTFGKIKSFLKSEKMPDPKLCDLNYAWLKSFDHYLMTTVSKPLNKPVCRNTANKHHSCLKTVLLSAFKEQKMDKNAYTDFSLKYTPSNREYLTEEEISKLRNHNLGGNTSLQRVRDMFLFSVYSGLRFSDALTLRKEEIIYDKTNRAWIDKIQEKTNEKVNVPILKQALDIVKKYESPSSRYIFQKISNQKLNAYLKTIAEIVGIAKTLTYHVARHTFATTVTLSNEIPVEIVSKWLGHRSIKNYSNIRQSHKPVSWECSKSVRTETKVTRN